ncbi:dihydrodipicolinate synthase family protein [Prosthecobacter sp.]|uniref:dihydrodipicolinate synthase family protein n=1 Tax=Prosthecobacter sp. TaxID=1965333 RepID=UPI002ABC75C8|nr:dihydrodipicolinate synthase family protein [Prosthecobacter sp.]MDZ4402642.1 dihydrodipicolinate synthase family protein [Prosthecobacter sp.]
MISPRYRPCVLATCCIPWNERFEFEEVIFRRSVRLQIASGIRDLYIFGTAGEGYAVTETQFDAVTRVFLDETRIDGVQAMIGLISQSLPMVIERIERARDMGARRFQLSLPSWGVLNDAELKTFFRETCGRFPDCEFLHYNLMRTGRIVTGAEYGLLAGEYENLVATKNSTADEARLTSLMTASPQLQHFITEAGFAKAALMGECGFLISFTSTNFVRASEYFRAGCEQDAAKLAAIARDFDGLIAAFKEAVGSTAHMDGAFDKLFCRVHDPKFPLRLLPPYEGVSDERFDRYLALLRQNLPHWLP